MKQKVIWTLVASSIVFNPSRAAESAASNDAMREKYVEGLRLISEVQGATKRANDLLSLVDSGATVQARKVGEMELSLTRVDDVLATLKKQSDNRLVDGKKLVHEKARLDDRFSTLKVALADDQALLAGATKTVDDLIAAADKSGILAERRLADQTADELKLAAEQLHLAVDRLAQMDLAVNLDFTLLQGLQAKSASEVAAIAATTAEEAKLAQMVAGQRASIDKLTAELMKNRDELLTQTSGFSQSVESFRLVQVAVLRRWLMDGPPAGEKPSLTIMNVQEAGFAGGVIRPDAASTVLGPNGSGLEQRPPGIVESNDMIAGADGTSTGAALSEASSEVIQLNRRARWYLAMLSRLSTFAAKSLEEAATWRNEVENWRNKYSASNRALADQHGTLATLSMEQDIVQTTVGLISAQAVTAGTQIRSISSDIASQTRRLDEVTAELRKKSQK